jgi:hypothetical protein
MLFSCHGPTAGRAVPGRSKPALGAPNQWAAPAANLTAENEKGSSVSRGALVLLWPMPASYSTRFSAGLGFSVLRAPITARRSRRGARADRGVLCFAVIISITMTWSYYGVKPSSYSMSCRLACIGNSPVFNRLFAITRIARACDLWLSARMDALTETASERRPPPWIPSVRLPTVEQRNTGCPQMGTLGVAIGHVLLPPVLPHAYRSYLQIRLQFRRPRPARRA